MKFWYQFPEETDAHGVLTCSIVFYDGDGTLRLHEFAYDADDNVLDIDMLDELVKDQIYEAYSDYLDWIYDEQDGGRDAEERERRRPAEALQGELHRRRAQVRPVALPPRHRDV